MSNDIRYGYNPNHAGMILLKFCAEAREHLISKLVKPSVDDQVAFEAWLEAKIAIVRMDYRELMAALEKE